MVSTLLFEGRFGAHAYLLPSTILLEIRKRAADIAGAQKTNRLPSREHERREAVQVRDLDEVLAIF
jgi:hypothetical protein